jgi:hypothetical protein
MSDNEINLGQPGFQQEEDYTIEDEPELGDSVNVPLPSPGATKATPVTGPAASNPTGNGIKMIHQGTGNSIPGDKWYKDANKNWEMSSKDKNGNHKHRPSTRLIYYKNKGPHGDCVPYHDLEVTAYVKVGPKADNAEGDARLIVTTGGPGQSKQNCCVYSLGFDADSGKAYAEEEGPHSPHPTIQPMDVKGGEIDGIGPIGNRTIGLKEIIYHDSSGTHVEGWVDKDANNGWKCFYKELNPHGKAKPKSGQSDLPVITKVPMAGDKCQEMRIRCDNYWPVDLIPDKSSIAEIVPPS